MTPAQPQRSPLTDLISSLEHLALLGRELQAATDDGHPLLISEVDATLAEAGLALKRLTGESAAAADPGEGSRDRGIDPLHIAYTVGITTVILPFVQGLVQRAGEDAYDRITSLVRRRRRPSLPAGKPTTVVLSDRETKTQVIIDARVDDAALAKLQQVDFADGRLHEATLRWDPDRQAWQAQPARPEVDLWLPGDPLDENS
jgi:hypothetical protein